HLETPSVNYSTEQWRDRERLPFAAAIAEQVDMVMTTHLVAKDWDDIIITGSAGIVHDRLRDDLGFDGVVVTDDLLMGGAAQLGDCGQRAVAALSAGHDLLLFGEEIDQSQEAYEAVKAAVRSGEIPAEQVQQALDRVATLKLKLARLPIDNQR
ncbi:hypothetical protein GF356_11295, partial [candidate division GN15 bacterium]|nr:hypothetical protein [candidate division GN15 bacterium]